MKKLIGLVAIIGMVFVFTSKAQALVFSDTISFSTSGQTVNEGDSLAIRSWTHDITDNINGHAIGDITITDAMLRFTYSDTNGSENWILSTVDTGTFTLANKNNAFTSDYSLNSSWLADLQSDGLITVTASENTSNTGNNFKRYSAILSGNYELKTDPTDPPGSAPEAPEPASMSLLGIGLVGLVGKALKKRSK